MVCPEKPKYQQVFENLEQDILSGRYPAGQRLPSEADLLKEFDTSRITIIRALRELQLRGFIQRRAGSGTYVADTKAVSPNRLFGLLIPNLGETEIFGPICQGIADLLQSRKHGLLWGNMATEPGAKDAQSLELCAQYVVKKIAGVFFAPLELTPQHDQLNRAVVSVLEEADIPIVLLDRDFLSYPERSAHDLVSVDHRRAGYLVTKHLLGLGCERIAFVAYEHSAPSIEGRVAGYQEALLRTGGLAKPALVRQLRSNDSSEVARLMKELEPDAIACANDRTAGHVMHSLMDLEYRVPEDIRIVGIDDVGYANLLPVPLTTIHQPCRELGTIAAATMLQRVALPNLPTSDILLDCFLVVRKSCGAQTGQSASAIAEVSGT
jgi:GntR family transcriptional regulator, arabinose operon transcriptional repressor